ncbi:MAG: ABC transporter substrate-binding protein [Archaeoglobaceae archaeon]|nr:ABC transporter substrate-binding protein [Archaeoglobaceae archaeon]MDW8118438.1 ABC transporter substrate-binding protein [Archaeoglobaceae archaeon]
MNGRVYFVFATIALVTAFALCVTQEKPSETKVQEIKVSYQPSWHHTALFVIIEKGWDEKVLGAKFKTTSFPSGPPQMEAFAAGEHEVAYVGAAPPLSLFSKGFDAKIVAVANTEGSSLVAVPGVEYNGAKSIEGKKIMTFPPGSVQHTMLMKWLKDNGVDLSKVEVKSGGPEEIREALKAKAIDFGFVPDPTGYVAEIEGYGKIVATSPDIIPNHPCCIVLMRGDLMKENREIAVKIIALHIIASEFAKDPKNKEEVKKILIKWLNVKESVADTYPGSTNLQTDPRIKEWIEGLDMLCEAQYQLKITKDTSGNPVRVKPENVVDPSLYEEALKLVPKIKKDLGLQ